MTCIYVHCKWLIAQECRYIYILSLYFYIYFMIRVFCLMLFITQERRLVDKCLFCCLLCGLHNKFIICKHLQFLLSFTRWILFCSASLGICFKIEHNCCIFSFSFCCLSVWHGLLIYNQTKKSNCGQITDFFRKLVVCMMYILLTEIVTSQTINLTWLQLVH